MTINMTQNDTSPSLELTITRKDVETQEVVVLDLNNTHVYIDILDLQTGVFTNQAHHEATITDSVNGLVQYDFESGDLPSAGSYRVDIKTVYDASGRIERQPDEFIIHARGQVS